MVGLLTAYYDEGWLVTNDDGLRLSGGSGDDMMVMMMIRFLGGASATTDTLLLSLCVIHLG